MEWLNRIGIILNFLAGFMLAPELLGIDRLKIIESKIEDWLSDFTLKAEENSRRKDIQNARSKLIALSTLPFISTTFLPYPTKKDGVEQTRFFVYRNSAFLYIIVIFAASQQVFSYVGQHKVSWLKEATLIFIILNIIFIIRGFVDIWKSIMAKISDISMINWLLFFIYMTIFTPGIILGLSISALFGTKNIQNSLIRFQLRTFSYLLKSLIGENQLRSLLVFWGIIFFVLGNLLQFTATF